MTKLGTWFDYPYSDRQTGVVSYEPESNNFIELLSHSHAPKVDGYYRQGGAFISKKSFVRRNASFPISLNPFGKKMYRGSVTAATPDSPPVEEPLPLIDLGPEAYRRLNPDKQLMGGLNSLFELKDLPGMIKGLFHIPRNSRRLRYEKRTLSLAGVSDVTLAIDFGWLPLLSDCVSLYQTQKQLAATIRQLKRDNGRPVRRRVELKNHWEDSKTVLTRGTDPYGTYLEPKFITNCYADGDWELSSHRITKVWASGQFRSWLPDKGELSDDQWSTEIAKRLYGLKIPSPSVIYKAMPWSWLIDWFGNVGDNMANLDTNVADRQINDYCYIMRHTEQFNRLSVNQRFRNGLDDLITPVSAVTEHGLSIKERYPASPFGFGLKIPDLSPFQLTILGSLGGSRMRF